MPALLRARENRLERVLLADPWQAAVLAKLVEMHGVQDEAADPETRGRRSTRKCSRQTRAGQRPLKFEPS